MNSIQSANAIFTNPSTPQETNDELKELSRAVEASFLAEMLKSAGTGQARGAFGGGAGEDHFTGFLVSEYAESMSRSGGIGLSEAIYNALTATRGTAP